MAMIFSVPVDAVNGTLAYQLAAQNGVTMVMLPGRGAPEDNSLAVRVLADSTRVIGRRATTGAGNPMIFTGWPISAADRAEIFHLYRRSDSLGDITLYGRVMDLGSGAINSYEVQLKADGTYVVQRFVQGQGRVTLATGSWTRPTAVGPFTVRQQIANTSTAADPLVPCVRLEWTLSSGGAPIVVEDTSAIRIQTAGVPGYYSTASSVDYGYWFQGIAGEELAVDLITVDEVTWVPDGANGCVVTASGQYNAGGIIQRSIVDKATGDIIPGFGWTDIGTATDDNWTHVETVGLPFCLRNEYRVRAKGNNSLVGFSAEFATPDVQRPYVHGLGVTRPNYYNGSLLTNDLLLNTGENFVLPSLSGLELRAAGNISGLSAGVSAGVDLGVNKDGWPEDIQPDTWFRSMDLSFRATLDFVADDHDTGAYVGAIEDSKVGGYTRFYRDVISDKYGLINSPPLADENAAWGRLAGYLTIAHNEAIRPIQTLVGQKQYIKIGAGRPGYPCYLRLWDGDPFAGGTLIGSISYPGNLGAAQYIDAAGNAQPVASYDGQNVFIERTFATSGFYITGGAVEGQVGYLRNVQFRQSTASITGIDFILPSYIPEMAAGTYDLTFPAGDYWEVVGYTTLTMDRAAGTASFVVPAGEGQHNKRIRYRGQGTTLPAVLTTSGPVGPIRCRRRGSTGIISDSYKHDFAGIGIGAIRGMDPLASNLPADQRPRYRKTLTAADIPDFDTAFRPSQTDGWPGMALEIEAARCAALGVRTYRYNFMYECDSSYRRARMAWLRDNTDLNIEFAGPNESWNEGFSAYSNMIRDGKRASPQRDFYEQRAHILHDIIDDAEFVFGVDSPRVRYALEIQMVAGDIGTQKSLDHQRAGVPLKDRIHILSPAGYWGAGFKIEEKGAVTQASVDQFVPTPGPDRQAEIVRQLWLGLDWTWTHLMRQLMMASKNGLELSCYELQYHNAGSLGDAPYQADFNTVLNSAIWYNLQTEHLHRLRQIGGTHYYFTDLSQSPAPAGWGLLQKQTQQTTQQYAAFRDFGLSLIDPTIVPGPIAFGFTAGRATVSDATPAAELAPRPIAIGAGLDRAVVAGAAPAGAIAPRNIVFATGLSAAVVADATPAAEVSAAAMAMSLTLAPAEVVGAVTAGAIVPAVLAMPAALSRAEVAGTSPAGDVAPRGLWAATLLSRPAVSDSTAAASLAPLSLTIAHALGRAIVTDTTPAGQLYPRALRCGTAIGRVLVADATPAAAIAPRGLKVRTALARAAVVGTLAPITQPALTRARIFRRRGWR